MKKLSRAVFILGSFMMLSGVISAGLTYREMRTQRLLHEPVRVFKIDPSQPSPWQTTSLPVYENGPHAVILSASAPGGVSSTGNSQIDDNYFFYGNIEIVVENPNGKVVFRSAISATHQGIMKTNRLLWFVCDTLIVTGITSSTWKISTRVVEGDSRFAGRLAELVIVPPHPEEFAPYLEHESYILYGSGILLVCGFFIVIFGGRFTQERKK